ncbi:MAG: hypothetical protein DMF60_00570, partial [Acidobacteria bacterium]
NHILDQIARSTHFVRWLKSSVIPFLQKTFVRIIGSVNFVLRRRPATIPPALTRSAGGMGWHGASF